MLKDTAMKGGDKLLVSWRGKGLGGIVKSHEQKTDPAWQGLPSVCDRPTWRGELLC